MDELDIASVKIEKDGERIVGICKTTGGYLSLEVAPYGDGTFGITENIIGADGKLKGRGVFRSYSEKSYLDDKEEELKEKLSSATSGPMKRYCEGYIEILDAMRVFLSEE